jgi:hypothetical protein
MIIGIDLDNTIIDYTNIFYKIGKEKKININKKSSKKELKAYVERTSKREWTKIQGDVYGNRILEAKLFKNFKKFLKFAIKYNIQLVIISHRTKRPLVGKKTNLHKAAYNFLTEKLDKNIFTNNKNLFFEENLKNKIQKIKEYDCDYFIDDLKKVLLDKKFPNTTERILFNTSSKLIKNFNNWDQITKFFKEQVNRDAAYQGRNNKSFNLINKKIFVKQFDKSPNSKNFFKELKFSQFLNNNKCKNTPKILNFSKERKVIKYEYKKDYKKNIYLKNLPKTIMDNFSFIKEINKMDYKSEKFNLATGFNKNLKDYKNEVKKRIDVLKKTFFYKHNVRFKNLIKKIEVKYKLLLDIRYFNKEYFFKKKETILSPCDFHFQNMVFNDRIYYIDFEYSGLDDPAKLYSIFYLQPEFNIDLDIFYKTVNKVLFFQNKDNEIKKKIILLMPIIYLRWSLILLNEFLDKNYKNKNLPIQIKSKYKNKNIQLIKANNYLKTRLKYFNLYKNFI